MSIEPQIRLAHPLMGAEVLDDFRAILESGRLTGGSFREGFEARLRDHHQVGFAVTTNSGTSALFALLRAAGVGPGDSVALPDFGFAATAGAVVMAGARPVFLDIEEESLDISLDSLEKAFSKRLRAVIPVHQFGLPAPLEPLRRRIEGSGAVLIEDAACALGTRLGEGALCGGTRAAAFSFHPRKIITTGEGGAVLTDDPDLAERVRRFVDHGFTGAKRDIPEPGMNLRLPEISCALGLAQLKRLEEIVEALGSVGERYRRLLGSNPHLALPKVPGGVTWNHQTYFAKLGDGVDRDRVIREMAEAGIECNAPAVSISAYDYYRRRHDPGEDAVKNSRGWARRIIGLPCHQRLRPGDIERVCDTLIRLIG